MVGNTSVTSTSGISFPSNVSSLTYQRTFLPLTFVNLQTSYQGVVIFHVVTTLRGRFDEDYATSYKIVWFFGYVIRSIFKITISPFSQYIYLTSRDVSTARSKRRQAAAEDC